jgi:hypothetical protein
MGTIPLGPLPGLLVVILRCAQDLCAAVARPFPFAEFTLERSEGLRAAAPALRGDKQQVRFLMETP